MTTRPNLTYIVNKAAELVPEQIEDSYTDEGELDLDILKNNISSYISQLEILVLFIDGYRDAVSEST